MRRWTRWLVAVLQGASAVVFSVILLGVPRSATAAKLVPVIAAFATIALVAFALWPMTTKGRGFSVARLTVFGALAALVGAYLWLLAIDVSLRPATTDASFLSSFSQAVSAPSRLLNLFGGSLDGLTLGILTFGLYMFPISIGIAWGVAIWGHNRS